jgi:DNA-binding SARP family transcriptional activator
VLRLTTFGGIALTDGERQLSGPAVQPRRLALLVLAAAAGDRGVSRDRVLGLLWPESDAMTARHALEQSLYALRRAVGDPDVIQGTGSLRVHPERLSSDIAEVTTAVAAGAHERVAALCVGPFLDGFHLSDVGEFERWVDVERSRFAQYAAASIEQLALTAASRGRPADAVPWYRRLADLDLLETGRTIRVIEALVAAGDTIAALAAAVRHERAVRRELDASCDPEVQLWLARLRATIPPRTATHETFVERVTADLATRYALDPDPKRGSVALTWRAVDRASGSAVMVHVIDPRVASLAAPQHFQRALERAGAIVDARIVRVLDVGAGPFLYYATAAPPGPSLRERMESDGPLPVDDAVRVARDVALALAHARAHGVRHWDIRPKHIFLTAEPEPVLVGGFGLLDGLSGPADREPGSAEMVIGDPAYLSPERLAGARRRGDTDDIYAVGCLLYHMLAGHPPFGATGGASDASRKLSFDAPSIRLFRERVAVAIERLLARALARVPADRFESFEALARALSGVREAL